MDYRKKTTQDQYRAEYQQIVPAPLSNDAIKLIETAGKFMASIAGANNGVCHNEIFLLLENAEVAGVEPNLRPAGMRIWDLAALAFDNFDPWTEWLLWAAGIKNHKDRHLKTMFYSGIRLFKSPKDGILSKTKHLTKNNLVANSSCEIIELVWLKQIGDKVSKTIKDNSDYIGYVIARARNYDDLIITFDAISNKIEQKVIVL